jgi:hypothetical protein
MIDQPLKPGNELNAEDRAYVLRAYVHRYTGDHMPLWADKPWMDNKPYPVQFANDQDWLRNTRFHVKKNGRLDRTTGHCESSPTWPLNPELRAKS